MQALHSCVIGKDQLAQKLATELKTQQIEKLTTTLASGNIVGCRCSFGLLLLAIVIIESVDSCM